MSVVKINALEVPEGRGEMLEQRFAARAGEVDKVDGFESFQLLRPVEGIDRYLVVTTWRDDASFRAWMESPAFAQGHAQGGAGEAQGAGGHGHGSGDGHGSGGGHGSGPGHGHGSGGGPAATGAELWEFEVVTSSTKA